MSGHRQSIVDALLAEDMIGEEERHVAPVAPAPMVRRPSPFPVATRTEFVDPPPHTVIASDGAMPEVADTDLPGADSRAAGMPTDFDHLLQQVAASKVDAQGRPVDSLVEAVQLREMRRRDDREAALPVSLTPRSWDRGLLGGHTIISANPDATQDGEEKQIVMWPGEDNESSAVTIAAWPANLVRAITNLTVRPRLRLRWGVQSMLQADVDLGSGTTIVLAGSSVSVSAYLAAGSDFGSGTNIEVYATLGFFAATPHNPPQLTTYQDNWPGTSLASSKTVLRPDFTSTIVDFYRGDETAQFTLAFYNADNTLLGTRVFMPGDTVTSPIRLANDCVLITITKLGGAATGTPSASRLIFGVL